MHTGARIFQVFKSLWFVALLAATTGVAAEEVAGVKLDDTVQVANQNLKLNGAGIRYKVLFKVYVTALYLPEKKNSVAGVLASSGPRRVTLVMLRDITNEDFGRAFLSGIHQNSDRAEKSKLVMQLQKFGELFASVPELKKGDVLTVDWVPGAGTVIHLNGRKLIEPIPDLAFYNAILKIWLGEKPADAALKPLLLGEKEQPARSTSY
jgi:hypothetical protein